MSSSAPRFEPDPAAGERQDATASVQVCRGTSCRLAPAPALPADVAQRHVYCLGYCHRSPALLLPDGRVLAGDAAIRGDPSVETATLPEVRRLSPESIVTERIARGDHSELSRARIAGVYRGLRQALDQPPEDVLLAIEASGERGRGGAELPTGERWRRCSEVAAPDRVVIANGDGGAPGAFVDRALLEHDPHAVLEGMLLGGYAVGASRGVIFVRGEYPRALARVRHAVEEARGDGLLGERVLGRDFAFDVSVHAGRGSYVCGEETALIDALEGRSGEVRPRPPDPLERGLHGLPTVVNGVESLVNAAWIVGRGASAYRALGTRASPGTRAMCLNAGFARPGIVEVEFGTKLERVILDDGGGSHDATLLEAVALGGPAGSVLLPEDWDVPVCYDAMARRGIQLGHAGLVALPRGTDLRALLVDWLDFMRDESCGRCVPCRVGSARALELARDGRLTDRLDGLLEVVSATSLCAFGQLLPAPVRTILSRFGDRL